MDTFSTFPTSLTSTPNRRIKILAINGAIPSANITVELKAKLLKTNVQFVNSSPRIFGIFNIFSFSVRSRSLSAIFLISSISASSSWLLTFSGIPRVKIPTIKLSPAGPRKPIHHALIHRGSCGVRFSPFG